MPGDHITASVSVNGTNTSFSLTDKTTGQSFAKTVQSPNPDTSSAEWIAEAPSQCDGSGSCTPLPLSDFGTVDFTSATATANGHTGTISDPNWTAQPVALGAGGVLRHQLRLQRATPPARRPRRSPPTVRRSRWPGSRTAPVVVLRDEWIVRWHGDGGYGDGGYGYGGYPGGYGGYGDGAGGYGGYGDGGYGYGYGYGGYGDGYGYVYGCLLIRSERLCDAAREPLIGASGKRDAIGGGEPVKRSFPAASPHRRQRAATYALG